MRAGSNALSLLAVQLNVEVLQALDGEPLALADLRRAVGHPPVTTMRSYLRRLTDLGLVERNRDDDFPGSVSYSILDSGRGLLTVAGVLRRWLREAPEGPLELGGMASRSAVKALVDGWDARMVRAMAARSLSLTELDRLIPSVTYPALERRLTAMRQVCLVEPDPDCNERVLRCRVTPWLRRAVEPLTAAVSWERRYASAQTPVPGKLDAEAAFLLVAPLLELPPELNGTCRLAVEFRRDSALEYAGATVTVTGGRACSCLAQVEGQPDAWITGSLPAWFSWADGADGPGLEMGGQLDLARALEAGLRGAFLSAAAS